MLSKPIKCSVRHPLIYSFIQCVSYNFLGSEITLNPIPNTLFGDRPKIKEAADYSGY